MVFSQHNIEWISGATPSYSFIYTTPFTEQFPGANGDTRVIDFVSDAGYFTIKFQHALITDSGITDVQLDGVVIASFDGYHVAPYFVQTETINDVLMTAGQHRLSFVVNGKNALSTGYRAHYGFTSIVPR